MYLVHLFVFVVLISISVGRNASDVFAPYIAASANHREAKDSSVASASVSHSLSKSDQKEELSEEQARHLVLARPGAHTSRKGYKKKSYAQGHTYIPTVNLKKPSHPVGKFPRRTAPTVVHPGTDTSSQQDASEAHQPDSQIKSAKQVNDKSGKVGSSGHHLDSEDVAKRAPDEEKQSQADIQETVRDSSFSADLEKSATGLEAQSPTNMFRGSTVLPLSIAATLLWLVIITVRRSGRFGAESRRKTLMLRKRLTSPKDMRV
eukprot:GFKZ01010110.1.p1 GENE.GFKZ01010110.1~~GFKZ01010110.1.p1  ORF type:complete len:262 (-),score=37.94 GFKZ01010110.1:1200-1985(-)